MSDRPLHSTSTARVAALSLGALLALVGCGGGDNPAASSTPIQPLGPQSAVVELDGTSFNALVTGRAGVELVEFYHPDCSHCQKMVPVVEQLARAFEGRAVVGRVSVVAQPDLGRVWGVAAYPAFVYVKNGAEVSRSYGETSYDDLASVLEYVLAGP